MKNKNVIATGILLFTGLVISEIPTLLRICWPETSEIKYNLFLQKSYAERITVQWYIYELGHIFNRIIWIFVFCQLAKTVSRKLFYIGVTFFAYQMCNFCFYLWDRNTSAVNNLVLYFIMAFVLLEIMLPPFQKGKVKKIWNHP